MEAETRERFSVIIDEIKKYEGFQETAEVGGRHQACDKPLALSTGPFGDSRKSTRFHNDNLNFHSVTTLMVTSMFPRVAFEYGHVWCAGPATCGVGPGRVHHFFLFYGHRGFLHLLLLSVLERMDLIAWCTDSGDSSW